MTNKDFPFEKITFSWSRRLPRQSREHPRSLHQFDDWNQGNLDQAAFQHNGYLHMFGDRLQKGWLEGWRVVFAVGPFTERKRPHKTIPFVLIAEYRRPYRHLIRMSELLAQAYQEYLILPDIYIMTQDIVTELESADNREWIKTKQYSIQWTRDNTNA